MSHSPQKLAVIGLGATGYSCVKYLCARGDHVSVFDTRPQPPYLTALKKDFPGVCFAVMSDACPADFDALIVSPGVSSKQPMLQDARDKQIPIMGDIELFFQAVDAPVIGITGSNGKSTVTTLVGKMLQTIEPKAWVGGNLGTPVLEAPLDAPLYVLELSSFQLDLTLNPRCQIACLLNITPDHLDRHGSFANYVAAKQRIFLNATTMIFNRDDSNTKPAFKGQMVSFGGDAPTEQQVGVEVHQAKRTIMHGKTPLCSVESLPPGVHHLENAMAAFAIGLQCQVPIDNMVKVLTTFKPLAHRCDPIGQYQSVTWINDSKATNVGATRAALYSLQEHGLDKTVLIMGGQTKGCDFSSLKSLLVKVKKILLIGADSTHLATMLKGYSHIEIVHTLNIAVQRAKQLAVADDIVIFSPACASFDQFNDYRERGMIFESTVKEVCS